MIRIFYFIRIPIPKICTMKTMKTIKTHFFLFFFHDGYVSVTFYKNEECTWYTELLWINIPPELGRNKAKAIAVMKATEQKAIKANQQDEINASIKELLDLNFAEEFLKMWNQKIATICLV